MMETFLYQLTLNTLAVTIAAIPAIAYMKWYYKKQEEGEVK